MELIDKLLRKTIDITEIPELPAYARIAISSTLTGEKSIERLIRTVRDSPSLTLKLLKVANSSFYGRAKPVSSIKDAIVLLGYKTVKSIILSITIRDLFQKNEVEWFDYKGFFLHSIAVAILCEELARMANLKAEEELYTAGILHDIGKALFLLSSGEQYKEVVETIEREKITFREAERKVFGFDHTDAARFLLHYWEIPQALILSACGYHNPELDPEAQEYSKIAIVRIANEAAHITGYVTHPQEPPYTSSDDIIKRLGILTEEIDPILDTLKERLSIVSDALNIQKRDMKGYYELISSANKELGMMYLQNQELMVEVKKKESLLSKLRSISEVALTEKDIEVIVQSALRSLLEHFPINKACCEFYINDDKSLIFTIQKTEGSSKSEEDFEFEKRLLQRGSFSPSEGAKKLPMETEDGQKLGILFITSSEPLDQMELESFLKQFSLALNNTKLALTNRIKNERLNIVVQKLKEEIDKGKRMAELNRLILENSPLGILSIDEKGSIIRYNQQAVRIFGEGLEEKNLFETNLIIQNELERTLKIWFGKPDQYEVRVARKNEQLILNITITPIEGTNNILLFIEDITERKENERIIIQREKMVTLGELASGIVHNLRDPLAAAKDFPELILSEMKSKKLKIVKRTDGKEAEDKEFRKIMKLIEDNIARALSIIDSIMEFSKEDFGSFENVLLSDVVEAARSLLYHRLKEKNIAFTSSTESCSIYGNRNLLTQIFINLLTNSINAVEEGGTIEVICHKEKDRYIVHFSDNGIGVEEKYLERIFEPFFTTSKKADEIGIGLSIARKLVTIHEGSIRALPRKDGGTVMELIFPVKKAEPT